MTGFTVALIGPDGAGKTTVSRRIEQSLPVPVKYIYMGVNTDASNVMLPTTRAIHALKRLRGTRPQGGPPDPTRRRPEPRGGLRRVLREARSLLALTHRLAEEWFRQTLAWYHVCRGRIVLFDRHFYSDYYAHDIFLESDTSIAVLSDTPSPSDRFDPLTFYEMRRTREIMNQLSPPSAKKQRVLLRSEKLPPPRPEARRKPRPSRRLRKPNARQMKRPSVRPSWPPRKKRRPSWKFTGSTR